tara:strand:+ start:4751 stop:5230 length:480 start_codon:yes stop_codon:yes gene_type:complete
MQSVKNIKRQFLNLKKQPDSLFSIELTENIFCWNILFFGPPDTIYENGLFKATMTFPKDFPNSPPVVQFIDNIFHPNIYPDGKVCISILHDGEDQYGYESASERWNPSHSVSSILLSIISMLPSPNFESPANIDASVMCKDNYPKYKKQIYSLVCKTLS